MRGLPRIRAPVPAGFPPSTIPSAALRVPAAAALSSPAPGLVTGKTAAAARHSRRCFSTTPLRASEPPAQTTQSQPAPVDPSAEVYEDYFPDIPTKLVYPRLTTTATAPDKVTDPGYKPAETAEELEEVGGLADWWDEPAHWGSEEGVASVVRAAAPRFGPAEKVTDPAVLEVLVRRALVEALVVARFAGKGKMELVDRLFKNCPELYALNKVLGMEVVAGKDGAATLRRPADWQSAWDTLNAADRVAAQRQQQSEEAAGTWEIGEGEAAAEPEVGVKLDRPISQEFAQSTIERWGKAWKKAELRDPVVKFYAAKRIQQLTGHRIPDGKLVAVATVDTFIKQVVEPPKPKKLFELVENNEMFKDQANVKVYPRRVTPIDKEQMVGRWKVIVKELRKRDLPITGTGDHGPPVEKKWISGNA